MANPFKNTVFAGLTSLVIVVSPVVYAAEPDGLSVQGFGAETVGGTGGRVVKVTTLANDGPGSLRWALEELTGPRIVHFDVAGTIQLDDQIQISGDVSVFGETAPGELTITGSRLRVVEDQVILRGLRIRPGDGPGNVLENRDGISIGKAGRTIRNVVIDSNSVGWAVDENISIWGAVQDVTISNNIIAHALDEAGHPKGGHSMGLLIGGGDVSRVSVIGNLFANNANRNPTIKDNSREIEVVNNLIYNWSENGLNAKGSTAHILGNVYLAGPDSVVPAPVVLTSEGVEGPLYFLDDNEATARSNEGLSSNPVFEPSNVVPRPSSEVKDWVLSRAGARLPTLDQVDADMILGVQTKSGRIINSPTELNMQTPPSTRAASN